MKTKSLAFLSGIFLTTPLIHSASIQKSTPSTPNVIMILTDDQGYGDLGYHGNPHVNTPVLDKLAHKSVRFTNFYVSPVCAPTRASLMTGRYSLRTGVHDTYNGGATMAAEETTLAEILEEAGYKTGIFGKWHLGDNYPLRPMDQGFQESLVHLSGGIGQVGDYLNYDRKDSSYFDPKLIHNGEMVQSKGYCSDVFTQATLEFIEENAASPFFVYLSFNAPHTPLQVPVEYYNRYKDLDPSLGFSSPLPKMSEGEKEAARKVYAMVSNIDDNVGLVLKKLKSLKIEKNTLVFFMTDNGPQQFRYLSGFRGRKGLVYEGGVHVPCFMSLPGQFPKNKDIDVPAAHIDIVPTIAELCGASVPSNLNIDGKSLLPLIEGTQKDLDSRNIFFYWTRRQLNKYSNMAVLNNRQKLVGNTSYDASLNQLEFYNLEKDPGEQNNLLSKETPRAKELKQALDNWYDEMITSPHLWKIPTAVIGTPQEDPTVLNRNDADGTEAIWDQQDIYGFWNVRFAEPGHYDITLKFRKPLDKPGTMKIQLGPVMYTKEVKETGEKTIVMKDVYFPKCEGQFTPWYFCGNWGKFHSYFPFVVKIKRTK